VKVDRVLSKVIFPPNWKIELNKVDARSARIFVKDIEIVDLKQSFKSQSLSNRVIYS
jgi:hypothetical protein